MSFLLQFQPGKSQEQLGHTSAKRPKKIEIPNLTTNNRLKEKQHGIQLEDDSIIGVRTSSRRSISTRSSPGQQQLSVISTKASPTQNLMINLSTKSLLTPLFHASSSKSNSSNIKETKQDSHHQIQDEFFLSNRFTKLPSKDRPKFGLLQKNSKSFISNDTVNFSDALLTQTTDEDQLKGLLYESKEDLKLQMLSTSLSPKPQSEISKYFPSTADPLPLSNSNSKKKLIILKKQNFRDFSNLISQRVDQIDNKITSKEYYDTTLLTQKQIDRMDVIRSNKQSMYFTALKNRGYAYQDNCINSPRNTSNQFETIDTSDFHAIAFTKKEAQDMLKPLISELQQKQKTRQDTNGIVESIEQFDLKPKIAATRQDAVSLEEWLYQKTNELFESNILNGSDLFNEIQKLYSASLQELTRQVSLQCTERGSLLKKIWTSYLSLFKKILQFKSEESSFQEKSLLNEITRIHKMYGEQIQTVQDKFQIASDELQQSSETQKKLQAEITQLNGNINGLQWALYVKSQIVSDYRGNLKKLETENQRLTHKLSQQPQQRQQKLLYKQGSFSSAVIVFQSEEDNSTKKPTVIQEALDSDDESQELEGTFNLHAPPITFDSIKSNGYFMISQDSGNNKGTDTNELVGEFLEKQRNLTEEIKRLKKLTRAQTQQLNQKRRFGEQFDADEMGQINNSLCIKQNCHKSLNDFGIRWTQQAMKGKRSSTLEFENEVRRTDDFLREWRNHKETKSCIKICNNSSTSEWTQLIQELKSMQNNTKFNVQGKLNELISCFDKIQNCYNKKMTEIATQNNTINNNNSNLLPTNSNVNQSSESSKILRNAGNSTPVTSFHVLQPVKSLNRISATSLAEFEDETRGMIILENEKTKEEQVKKFIKLSDELLRKISNTQGNIEIQKQTEKQISEWKVLSKQVTQLDIENLLGLIDMRAQLNRLEAAEGQNQFHSQFHGDDRKQQQLSRKSATNGFRDIEETNSQIFHVIQEDSEGVSNQSEDSSNSDDGLLSSSNNKSSKHTQSDMTKNRKSQQRGGVGGDSEDERFPQQDDQLLMSQISFGVIHGKSTPAGKDSKNPRVSQLNLNNLPATNSGSKSGKNNFNNPRRGTVQGLNRRVSQSPSSKQKLQQQTSIVMNDKFSAKRGSVSQNLIHTGTKLARLTSNIQITETTIPSPRRESISPRIKSLKSQACISEDAAFKIVQDILFEIKGAQMKSGGGASTHTIIPAPSISTATLIQYDSPAVLKPYFSKLNAIKFISSVYAESMRLPRSRNQKLYAIAYELLLNKYGLKRVAERKLEQYLKTCLALSPSSKRLTLFCRFCSLIVQPRELEIDEFNFFLQVLQAMDDRSHSGMGFIKSLEESIICPLDKMVEFLTGFLEKEEDQEKVIDKDQNLYQIIIEALQPVAFMQNEVLFLDIDGSFEILVDLYRKKKQEVEKNVKKLFYAADLDKNECIELREFLTLYRYLENPQLKLQNVSKMFFDAADTRTKEGEKALTLERFAAVCLDNKLFSQTKQREFAQSYSPADYVKSLEELQLKADQKFTEIRMRLKFSGALSPSFEQIISSIQSLLSPQLFKENSHKDMLWISYRLLDEDSKRLYLNKLVDSLLGDELLVIASTHAQLDEHNSIIGCLSDSFAE